jgi:hypothetical protein
MLHFVLDDTEYEFDQNKLALFEALAIKKELGLTVAGMQAGMRDLDPEALIAVVWLSKKRAGEAVRIQDIDFDVMELIGTFRHVQPPGETADPPVGPASQDGSDTGMTPNSDAPPI